MLDSLLSFQTRSEVCTLGQLIMSPSEQVIGGVTNSLSSLSSSQHGSLSSISATPPQPQKKRSSFSLRKQSRDKGKELSPSSSIGSKIFQVGSVDSMSAQEGGGGGGGSVGSNVLQTVSMDGDVGAGASQLDSLNSLGQGLELVMESGPEQGSLSGASIPSVLQASSDVSVKNYAVKTGQQQQQEREDGARLRLQTGQGALTQSIDISLQMDAGSFGGDLTMTAMSVEAADSAAAMSTGQPAMTGIVSEGEGKEACFLLPQPGVGGYGVPGQSTGGSGTLPGQVALNLELEKQQQQQHDGGTANYTYSLNNKDGYGGGVVYDGVDGGGGAGSIMNADSAPALDLEQVPEVLEQASEEPFSPVLPTTTLELGVEEREGVEQGMEACTVSMQEVGVVSQSIDMGSGITVELSHQNSVQGDVCFVCRFCCVRKRIETI